MLIAIKVSIAAASGVSVALGGGVAPSLARVCGYLYRRKFIFGAGERNYYEMETSNFETREYYWTPGGTRKSKYACGSGVTAKTRIPGQRDEDTSQRRPKLSYFGSRDKTVYYAWPASILNAPGVPLPVV